MKMNHYKSITLFVVLSLAVYLIAGCDDDFTQARFDQDEENMQIYDYISNRPDLSVYKALSDYSGFYGLISTAGTYTVFIPTDSAFRVLFDELGIQDYKEKDGSYWLKYLQYHAIEAASTLNTNTFENGELAEPTLLGDDFYLSSDISQSFSAIKLNNTATIREYNIKTKNGLIQIIDHVLPPPIQSIFEKLQENGGYTKMLRLFEENGLKGFLSDSTVTIMIEPDEVFEASGFNPDTVKNVKEWLNYHIIPNERSFTNELDGRYVETLYEHDGITFNIINEQMMCNRKFGFSVVKKYGVDNVAINGVYHAMAVPLQIIEHSTGKVRYNLYGRTDAKKGYVQNVFAVAPATVTENVGYSSYHQDKEPPVCSFNATQVGDVFKLTIPSVVAGAYKVRIIYYVDNCADLMMIYKDEIVTRNIEMNTKDGDFQDWSELKYKDCGEISLTQRGDVELAFQVTKRMKSGTSRGDIVMDMIELIPVF